jgi:hypothetical protein
MSEKKELSQLAKTILSGAAGVQKAYDQGKNIGSIINDDESTFEKIHRRKK